MRLSVIVPILSGETPATVLRQVAGRSDVEIVSVVGVVPVGRARNAGLARATGDYVAWVDADDEVADGWLAEILAALASGPDVVVFDAESVGWPGKGDLVLGEPGGAVEPERLVRAVYENGRMEGHLFRTVTRRSLWDGLAFDESVSAFEDFLLLPHVLMRAKSAACLPRRLYRYVCRSSSLVSSASVVRQEEAVRAAIRRFDETPGPYRAASAFGSVWRTYHALEAVNVLPDYRGLPPIDPLVGRAGRAFLRRHGWKAARSPRDAARLAAAAVGFWRFQRLAFGRRAKRRGSE